MFDMMNLRTYTLTNMMVDGYILQYLLNIDYTYILYLVLISALAICF